MRQNLKAARKARGMTQQAMADLVHVSLSYYKAIESGARLGGIDAWDALEDATGIHQRLLREISPVPADNR